MSVRKNAWIAPSRGPSDVDRVGYSINGASGRLPASREGWESRKGWESTAGRPLISVIIPTFDEESTILSAIASASAGGVEVVVADGGSTDRTRDLASGAGATVIRAKRGRGSQMNAGAAVAGGEILIFLHADTVLPPGFGDAVLDVLGQQEVSLCAFRLSIAAKGWSYRVIEKMVQMRSRVCQMPYGDQALSVRADVFRDMDGYRDWPVMEDYAFVDGLRRVGRVTMARLSVVTSPRRWRLGGVLRTTLANRATVVAFRLGVPPARIAKWRASRGERVRRTGNRVG
jgi:rSAM/selenodomain-associated transferase 2